MILEHLVYSIAIAIIFGMIYRRITGRESSWIIVLSAYAPDVDIIADAVLRRIGVTVLVYGTPIDHGDFHNLGVLLVYAVAVSFLLHPLGIRFVDSFIFASVGFAAHAKGSCIQSGLQDAVAAFIPKVWDWRVQKADLYGVAD